MLRCRSVSKGFIQRYPFSTASARLNTVIVMDTPKFQMPGFNVPLNTEPWLNVITRHITGFPNALDPKHIEEGYLNQLVPQREITMMRIMNSMTEKPDWHRKVRDDAICRKWEKELLSSGEDVSQRMVDWIFQELLSKARLLEKSGYVEVFDGGVIKSDSAISPELQVALKEAVAPLENIPAGEKDYHPGSNDTVVDLVHPSLFPLVYGQTRILPDRLLGLDDCLEAIGEGKVILIPSNDQTTVHTDQLARNRWLSKRGRPTSDLREFSARFQWLPCEVERADNGAWRIQSYINNAHPVKHQSLYEVVERILTQTMPQWEKSLSANSFVGQRIEFTKVEWEEGSGDEPEWDRESDPRRKKYHERMDEWYSSRRMKQPEPPAKFKEREPLYKLVDFEKQFYCQSQVIVKLANIELTPERPRYEGGSWHIEGQLNERIAASAIYYYDSQNITSSSLAFRHRAIDEYLEVSYEQDQHQFLQQVYGLPDHIKGRNTYAVTQELGSVETKEGRLITFPNTLQHRVSPFSLADPTKPGHRKILALFLVDPHHRIISTANVPPQREDWVVDKMVEEGKTMSMDEAKALRVELMEERGMKGQEANATFEEGEFCLCEH